MTHETTIDLTNPPSSKEPPSMETATQQHLPRAVARCAHVYDQRSALCLRHLSRQKKTQDGDHSAALTRDADAFCSPEGIRHSLSELYVLLAQNRISTRRASVLAFIGSLMIRLVTVVDTQQGSPQIILNMQQPER
jgi:hypothetical protein